MYVRHYQPSDFKELAVNQRKAIANMRRANKSGQGSNHPASISAALVSDINTLRGELQGIIARVASSSLSNDPQADLSDSEDHGTIS